MSFRVPKYRFHKGSGQAMVEINGRRIYLGRYGSLQSQEKYRRLLAEHLSNGNASSPTHQTLSPRNGDSILISHLILAYWRFAQEFYRKNGKLSGETDNIRAALRPLRRLDGSTIARDFGPDALELVRQAMIDDGLSRGVINGRVSRIKRMFRWASKKKMVPPETFHGLLAVEGLRRGRSKAKETSPVATVPEAHVLAALPHLLPPVRAMIRVQELAGMRPQDIRNLRTCDLDMTGDVWAYAPWTHKTEHHGIARRIAIGPKAQPILQPLLKPDEPPTEPRFSRLRVTSTRRGSTRRSTTSPTSTPSMSHWCWPRGPTTPTCWHWPWPSPGPNRSPDPAASVDR